MTESTASAGIDTRTAAIDVQDVGWTIGGATILADITLQIGKGELVAVIGPNGAGKSTLVNVISGVTRPSTGRILLTTDASADFDQLTGVRAEVLKLP